MTLGSNKYHTVINIGLVTLLLDGGPKLAVGIEQPGDQVCLGNLVVGGNFVCWLIIVVIFKGLGRSYRLEGDFEVIIWWASHKGMEPFLWGKSTSQDTM